MESASEEKLRGIRSNPKIEIAKDSSEELFKTMLVSIKSESNREEFVSREEVVSQNSLMSIQSPSAPEQENIRRSLSVVSTHATQSEIFSALAHSNPIKQSRSYNPQLSIPLSASLSALDCPAHLKPLQNFGSTDSSIAGDISNRSSIETPLHDEPVPLRLTEFGREEMMASKNISLGWSDVEEIRRELNERTRERDRLQNELKYKDEKVSSLRRQMEDIDEKNMTDNEQVKQLKGQVRKLERECEVGRQEKNSAEEGQQWLQSQLDQMMKERIKLQQELAASRGMVLTKGAELETAKAELSKVRTECSNLRTQSLKERAQIVTTLEGVEEEVLEKDSRLEELNSQMFSFSEEKDQLCQQVNELREILAEQQIEKEDLESQLQQHQDLLAETRQNLEGVERKKQELKRELSQVNAQFETKDVELSEIYKARDGLQVQKAAADRLLVNKDNILGGLGQEKHLLDRQLEANRQEISQLNTQLVAINGELVECKKRAYEAELEEETKMRAMQRAIQERDFAEDELRGVKQDVNALLGEKASNEKKLQKELEAKEKKFRNLQYAMKDVAEKMTDMEERLKDKSEREELLIAELDAAKRESKQANIQLNKLQGDMGPLKTELGGVYEEAMRAKQSRGEEVRALQEERGKLVLQLNQAQLEYGRNLAGFKQEMRQAETNREGEVHQLTADQQQLREKLFRTEETLARAASLNAQLEQEVRNKMGRADLEKARSLEKLEKRYTLLQQQNEDLKATFENNKREMETMQVNLSNSQGEKSQILRALDQAKRESNRKTEEIEQVFSQRSYESETLKSQLNTMQAGYAQLTEHAHALERALAEKEATLTRLSGQAELVLSHKQVEDEEMQQRMLEMTTRVRQSEKERDSAFYETGLLRERVKRIEADLRASFNDQTSLQNRKDSQELKITNLEEKYNAAVESKKEIESRYKHIENERSRFQSHVGQLENQNSKRNEQANFLQDRLNMAQSQITDMEAHSRKLEEMLSSSEKRHQSELQSLRGMYSTLQDTSQPRIDYQLSRGSSTSLRSAGAGTSKNVAALQNCLISLKEDMGKLQSQMYKQAENVNTSYTLSRKFENNMSDGASKIQPKTSTPKSMSQDERDTRNYNSFTDYN